MLTVQGPIGAAAVGTLLWLAMELSARGRDVRAWLRNRGR